MSPTLLQTAAMHLKRAVPLMLKHSIPTTPTNYALWYTYVGEQNPTLNQKLDTIISQYSTCPPIDSEQLYRQFVADPTQLDVRNMRQNLDAMATELSQSLTDTRSDASTFQNRIKGHFDKLHRVEDEGFSVEQVLDLVRNFVKEADDIRSSTEYFTEQLARAQSEITSLRHRLEQTEKDMLFDALTSCLNRRAFDEDLAGLLTQSPQGTCLILLDIDHFKAFNDSYGHQLGDLVLKAVAKRVQEACRDGAKLYRVGGEEFGILVPGSQLMRVRQLAEAIRRSLEKLSVKDRRSGNIIDNITASFGVAQWQAKQSSTQVFEVADNLLYQAKNLGRNRVMPMAP
ncbi:GGDEF domain-containing protein [Shewanella sp. AS16]|uniref:diguanylate cyclase domain-containing protein n=1 Tax=Shewanella sp. AS16 TaxID=2907625 RepID=UPI001F3BD429|nr:diguanylate cyclase [Shewanella sp. AS16]MCE9687516.1 GGDEF domain-containing protein [Shewanella sp. AS16]